MELRFFLKQLILPPGGFFLLILLAWLCWSRRPSLAALCLLLGLGGLWLMSLPVVVEQAARWLEREPALVEAQWPQLAQRAEVIVVIGSGREEADPAWGSDQPSATALERLRYAARLHRASGLPLMMSGGLHYDQPPSEAAMMAEVLQRDFSVPTRWQEERSRTTWENAEYSAALLREQGIRRVVLVTQAAHMPRALWCFERQGLDVVAAPLGFLGVANARPLGGWLPEGKALWQSTRLLNEALGQALYPLLYR
ncbi:YdcF family protein [Aquipseudomonas ullengensis]|uniref:YdcF family protein n=1 Tax=Aquipseudomonas ullengensis TaxID=2759166 RepID=A0A7W4Q8D5_9GAMM|nr:YdcF family protein [Pseudomonas ullengensis]MBB2493652.1 YdcF family protein [Pseudomonas ullengensis]